MTLTCTEPPASVRAGVQDLYNRGLILSAYRLGEEFAPLPQWGGAEGRVLAGRILGQLGSPRLGRSLHVRAFREHPDHPRAAYYKAYAVLNRRGPLAAMRFQRENPLPDDASETIRADWLAFAASMAAVYRDFESAEDLMAQAERLKGDRTWIICERSRLLESQDRYDESLATARRALEIRPGYRVAVQRVAHLLQIADRDDQALELLQSAVEQIESVDVVWQLAALQDHLELHAEAMKTIDRLDALCPLRERKFQQNIAWLKSNVAYHAGRLDDAIAFAEQVDNEFLKKVAAKLKEQIAAGNTGRRVLLDFPFVRQHHMTCGPATLAAIGRFFSRPVEHLAVVDAICYDGTSAYSERNWAQSNGWVAREFVLSWDAAKALIDRGIPFALATVNIPNGHLQAVIGYDPMRGTILCRDPYQYYVTEFSLDLLLEYNGAYGPRAMVILPTDQALRLEGLNLPDADKFDLLHQIEKALAAHDRPAAQAALQTLESMAPADRLTFHGKRTLAVYDSNPMAQLESADALLAMYPKSQPLKLTKAYLLRGLERRDLLMPLLEEACAGKSAHPLFLQFLATQLQRDAGTDRRVRDLLTRSLRRLPTDGASLGSMANVFWSQRKREEATVLYNLASCVDDKNEWAAQTYFNASRCLRQTDQALSKLRRRFERLGGRSGEPACTLYWALDSLNRTTEALEVLEQARARRPSDGQLLLFSADAIGRRGDMASAAELLSSAKDKTRPTQWLRAAAKLAQYRGDLAEATDGWKQVLAAEPLADDANMRVANLIAQTESPDAAAAHLLAVHERFPHNTRIQQLRIDWLAERGGAAAAVPVATELVAQQPGNIWARTRLSHLLTETGDGEDAVRQAQAALEIAPHSSNAHNALGVARARLGRVAEARRAFQRAIHDSVDFTPPIYQLVNSFRDTDGKRKALRFVHRELVRQVIFGDGLIAYQELARGVIDRADALAVLHEAHDARPDLWQTWSALTQFLAETNELDAALAAAREAVDRFPLLPKMRLDLSHVQSLRGDLSGQIESLTECLRLSPSWSAAARRLAAAHQRGGEPDKALAVLQRATQRDPLDADTHEALARALWKAEQREPAIASMQKAIRLNPASIAAWNDLRSWSDRLGRAEEVANLARDLTRQRAGDAVAWMSLVRALSGPGAMVERLAACDTAIKLSPRNADIHDLKAWLLWQNGRRAEALAACDPPEFNGEAPINLIGRHAWLLWQQGKADDALLEMVGVLARNGQYLWGWERLLEWRATRKDPQQYLADAQAMVAAFPHYHTAHVHLAKAQFATGDRPGAKATLDRLLSIAPDNTWALDALFSSYLEDKQYHEATDMLGRIGQHCSKEYTGSRRVLLAAAKRDEAGSAEALSALCGIVSEDAWSVRTSTEAMDKAGMVHAASRVLDQAVKTGGAKIAPAVVEVWCERLAKKKKWRAINAVLKRFPDDSPQWRAGAYPFINAMANARAGLPVRRLISRHREVLRKHTRLWGSIGFALLARGRRRACIEWLSDWEQRGDAEPWMLLNLVNCLRSLGRAQEARKVQLSALSKKADHAHVKYIIWLAFDEVSSGVGNGEYIKALGQSDTTNLVGQYPLLLNLIRALEPLSPAEGKLPRGASRQARQAIRNARLRKRDWWPYGEQRAAVAAAVRRVRDADPNIVNKVYAGVWLTAIPVAGFFAALGMTNTTNRKSPSKRKR